MDGIIFDLDGTLWDSTEEVVKSWKRAVCEQTNLNVTLEVETLVREFGKPMDVVIKNTFPELSDEERASLTVQLFRYENEWMKKAPCKLYPHMKETIQKLSKKYPLFIVSNCQAGYIEAFLENTGLQKYFADHLCPDDTGRLKADNIKIIMERNGIEEAVYVGDTQGDADACKEAGVPMVYAAYGFGNVEDECVTIQQFDQLLDLYE